jgi:hypothetical protein
VIYILILAVFAAGLWLILKYGSATLVARQDLAGEWELSPLPGTGSELRSLRIEQSGRYCNIVFNGIPALGMKLI